jgi:small conductance mechanosensitive channel
VGVAYREDVDEVMEVLREIGEEMQKDPEYGKDILEPLEILGVDQFADSAVIIKARITTKPIRQWAVGREFNRRMKKVFDQRGIEIPFPHHTIYMGEPKEGRPPALQVHLQERDAHQGGEMDNTKE